MREQVFNMFPTLPPSPISMEHCFLFARSVRGNNISWLTCSSLNRYTRPDVLNVHLHRTCNILVVSVDVFDISIDQYLETHKSRCR